MTTDEIIQKAADHANASTDEIIEQVASDFATLDPSDYANGYATILAKHGKSIAKALGADEAEMARHIVEMVKRSGDVEAYEDARSAYRSEYDADADVDVDRKRQQIEDVRADAPSHIKVTLVSDSVKVLDTSRDEDPDAVVPTDRVLYQSDLADFDPAQARKAISLFKTAA